MSSKEIEKKYKLTNQDSNQVYLASLFFVPKGRKGWKMGYLTRLLLAGIFIGLGFALAGVFTNVTDGLLFFIGLFVVSLIGSYYISRKKMTILAKKTFVFKASPEYITFEDELQDHRNRLRPNEIKRIIEKKYFLFVVTDQLCYMAPKRLFAQQEIAQLHEWFV